MAATPRLSIEAPTFTCSQPSRFFNDFFCIGTHGSGREGISMGGYVALNFGLTFREKAKSLTIVGAGHGSDPALREQFLRDSEQLAERLVTVGMEEGIVHYANSTIRRRFREKDPRGFERFNRQFAEHSALGSSLTMRGYQMKGPTICAVADRMAKLQEPHPDRHGGR